MKKGEHESGEYHREKAAQQSHSCDCHALGTSPHLFHLPSMTQLSKSGPVQDNDGSKSGLVHAPRSTGRGSAITAADPVRRGHPGYETPRSNRVLAVLSEEEESWNARLDRQRKSPVSRVIGRLGRSVSRAMARHMEPDEVLKQCESVCRHQIAHHGVDSREAATARIDASLQLAKMGRWEEALVLREQAFNSCVRHRGEEDSFTLGSEIRLAIALANTGRRTESQAHLQHAASVCLRTFGPDDQLTLTAQAHLARFE
jgi:hypothetical protein